MLGARRRAQPGLGPVALIKIKLGNIQPVEMGSIRPVVTAGKSADQFKPLQRRLARALIRGRDQTVCRRTAATCANLLKSQPSLWTFLREPRLEPTNNDTERALRSIVIKRKISGPTRSRRGDEFIARAFTVHETCRRQGRDLWDFLRQAVTAWIDKTTPPSLVPQLTPIGA